jgi:hypothetical protein
MKDHSRIGRGQWLDAVVIKTEQAYRRRPRISRDHGSITDAKPDQPLHPGGIIETQAYRRPEAHVPAGCPGAHVDRPT